MKRFLISTLVICLALSSIGSADMNRQIWDIPVNENLAGVKAFHEDKRPDMLPFDPVPDIDQIEPESWFGDRADNYYANLWGWVTIPESGTYTWHLHGDNHSVLHISTDENWENVEEVASIDGWSNIEEWNKYPTQTSGPFQYSAGQQLAVWAIMVEGGGGDNLGIGWTLPGAGAISYITDHVSIIPPAPTTARDPGPAVDTNDISRDTTLTWGAGEFAATHDVYFGNNFGDVNDRTPGALIGDGITATSSDPGRLEFGETYYWTVDEVNGAPDFTVHAGKIWSFTVEPEFIPVSINDITATASSSFGVSGPEQTVNHSGLVDDLHGANAEDMWISGGVPATIEYAFGQVYKLQELWIWNSNQLIESFVGFGAKDVVIEHSLDGENWTVLDGVGPLAQATGLPGYAHNNTIDFGGAMAQHVRITINSVQGIAPQASLSEVRFLSIPVFAREPQPADGGAADAVNTTLAWRSGREAGDHEVVLSRDQVAVADGSTAAIVTQQNSFTPDPLIYGETYYWQVTETNAVSTPPRYEGPIWSFNAPEFSTVDDFESYADAEFLEIWATWIDGFGDPGNGSTVGNGNEAERSIVNEGSQSMPIHFDNSSVAISEVTRTFDPPLNFTPGEPEALVIDVRGEAPAFAEDAEGNITISAAGADIWDAADEFRFVYKQLSGDGSITARINSQTVVHDWSKVGVMIRESASPESANTFLPNTGVNGVRFQARTATFIASVNDDATVDGIQQNITRDEPVWVRIVRAGNTFTGSYTLEETPSNWTPLGTVHEVPMVANVLIGLAVTSHSVGNTVSGFISDVSTTGNVTGAWTVADLGGVHPDGSDADSMYVTVTDRGGASRTFTHENSAITQAVAWDSWAIPMTDLSGLNLNAISEVTIGVGTPGGAPSGAIGTAYVDWLRVGTPSP